eukprot:CAMPEP_0177602770 /NCGR_PEP_ID=MMETSP0419_2-20121207/15084_1 /TAXON_ID=582737 /ORGANISM="Tetraselmis sp., Strain GSL018" /LENGTH=228 /DNA_ID=CAMNT_0019096353 /DNA_START=547 /DNA_END=1234 /DNA_ORIENTATION=+
MEQGSLSLKYLQLKDYAKENLTRPNSSDATAALLARDLPSTQRPPRRWASSCVADRVRGFESFRPRADVRALARAQSQNGLTAQAGPLQGTPQARFVESAAVPSSGPTAARCASWTSLGPRDKLLQENGGAAAHEGTTYHLDRGPPDPQSQPQAGWVTYDPSLRAAAAIGRDPRRFGSEAPLPSAAVGPSADARSRSPSSRVAGERGWWAAGRRASATPGTARGSPSS